MPWNPLSQYAGAILISRFLLCMCRIYVASIRVDFTKNKWNAHNTFWLHAFRPLTTCNLIMHVLTICHVKLMQSTVLEQKPSIVVTHTF